MEVHWAGSVQVLCTLSAELKMSENKGPWGFRMSLKTFAIPASD